MKKILTIIVVMMSICCCAILVACNGQADSIQRSDRVYRPARYSYEFLGNVDRKLPEVKDGGLPRYPTLASRMPGATQEEKQAVLDENNAMYNFDKIDAEGNLFKNGNSLNKKLFKHSAADGQLGGAIPQDAKAVSKKIHIIPSTIGNNPTGLYAAPGEIIKIVLSEEDAARSMRCDIGMGSARGAGVVIPPSREYSRMPSLQKSVRLNDTENYVGSPLGGPIYLLNENEKKDSGRYMQPYDVTIIGAVESPHYYLGYTTDDEWERLKKAPGAIFDMDIFGGVRMTMPSSIIRDKSAENMRRVAEFWENASALSNKFSGENWYSDHPVTQIYDTYIPAGAAVAFVGADFSCLPIGWANGIMNFDSFVLNGAWGDVHEFNHHHQGWGASNGGEVTNNVLNAIAYMLYTNIGAQRTETGGLGGGNLYTSAYLSLKDVLGRMGKGANTEVAMYTTLIHAFGDDAMLAASKNTGARTNELWYTSASKAMGYDLTYYFETICGFDLSQEAKNEIAALNMPIYVPIANTYQAGNDRLVLGEDGKYTHKDIMMGKPFYIPYGKDKEIDLNAYMQTTNDVTYEIKNVTAPTHGKLVAVDGLGKYIYTPDKKAKEPSEFRVTVGLKFKDNPAIVIDDVTLIIQLMQDYSSTDSKLWKNPGYSDIETALSEGFEVLKSTDVQFSYAGADTKIPNSILKTSGKILLPKGNYKFFIKGNEEVLLMTGTAPTTLTKSAHITKKLDKYDREREGSYFEVEIKENEPLYYVMYVLSTSKAAITFGRIGYEDYSQIQGAPPIMENENPTDSITQVAPIVDIPRSVISNFEASVDAPLRAQFSPSPKYINEFKASGAILIDSTDFKVSTETPMYQGSSPNNMVDGDFATIMHSATNIKFPVEFVIDIKEIKTFNLINLYSREPNNNRARVKEFELYAAETIVEGYKKIYEGTAKDEYKTTLTFNPSISAKYIKIVVKSIYRENYICFSEIEFGNGVSSVSVAPASSNDIIYKGKWGKETFGSYLNGYGLSATNGASAEINFHGTDFMLFGAVGNQFGKGKIRVDDGEWQEINYHSEITKYGQPIFGAINLADGYHKVEIKAEKGNKINIDYFGIAPTQPPHKKGFGLWWIAIGIGAAAVCIGFGVVGFKISKSINNRKLKKTEKYEVNSDKKTERLSKIKKDDLVKKAKNAEKPKTVSVKPAAAKEEKPKSSDNKTATPKSVAVKPAVAKEEEKPKSSDKKTATPKSVAVKPAAAKEEKLKSSDNKTATSKSVAVKTAVTKEVVKPKNVITKTVIKSEPTKETPSKKGRQ